MTSAASAASASLYQGYLAALRSGDRRRAESLAHAALAAGIDIRDLYMDVFQPAMHEIGRLWECNQLTVAEEHLATAITQHVMTQLYPLSIAGPRNGHSLVATCIGGELHELGIRMVADFFEIEGWDVYYLGANVPHQALLSIVKQYNADLLAISVTLSYHVLAARELIRAVRASPIGADLKILVGGQPFNRHPTLFTSIGADFTAYNAREAVQLVAEVMR